MELRRISQLFGSRDVRNALVGTVVVVGGLLLAGLTLFAHSIGNIQLTGVAAVASLIFVLLILVFVVPPLAKNASREASQMNLPFEFTAGGAIMLGLAAIVGFSAWNTGNNLLFLILAFIFAAIIVAFFVGGYTLKKLDVKMRFPETIFAGEETHIFVSLTNRKRLMSSYSVVVEVRGKTREESIAADEIRTILPAFIANRLTKPPIIRRTLDYFVRIPRNATIETRTSHVFSDRGRFLIKDFELSTKFPFGFFRHRRRLPARETELIVFPKFEPINQSLDDLAMETGRLESTRRGLGQDLYAMREYRPMDDLRRVDWKATARSTQLTVREFSAEDDKRVNVVLDTRIPREAETALRLRDILDAEQKGTNLLRPERFEKGVSYAAALISYFTKEQAEIRLIIDDEIGEFGVGSRHLHDSLKRLAVAEPRLNSDLNGSDSGKIADVIETDEKSHTFLISAVDEAVLDPELVRNTRLIVM